MGSFTRDNTELAVDVDGAGQQHRAEAGGMTIALERWNAGLDTAEWFAELPDGACQEPHWGYCLKGRVTMRFTDGETRSSPPATPTTSGRATTRTSTRTAPSSSSSPAPTRRRASTPWRSSGSAS